VSSHVHTSLSDLAGAAGPRRTDWRPFGAALAVGLGYYAGARVGLSLTFMPFPLSVLWPPNALLLAALALAPTRWWAWLLLAALPAHLTAELQAKIPATMVLCWFLSNVFEAVTGALILRQLGAARSGLRSVRSVLVFCLAAVAAPLLSSFLDAGFVRLIGWGDADYWTLWLARSLTNIVATLTFVPVALAWAVRPPAWLRGAGQDRLEVLLLLGGLLVIGMIVFDAGVVDLGSSPVLLYLPVPFLIWAALRFGPQLVSVAFAVVAFLVIWGVGHGHGPFLRAATHDGALPIQLFLITIAAPLLLLAALIEERRVAERRLRQSEELFSTIFRAGPDAIAITRRSDGRVIEANDRWLELLGYERSGRRIATLAAHAGAAEQARLARLLPDSTVVRDLETALHGKDGSVRRARVSVAPIKLLGDACAITIVHDITELREAEGQADEQRRQLTHLTRVASLTDFSSTLAHELNQPLTAILSNAQAALRFLARDPPDVSELRLILREIADADKRAGLLIHHLRLLMKRGSQEFVPVELNQLVRETLAFANSAFVSRSVELATGLANGVPSVSGDPVQLQQLLLNLISNACDAMQGRDPCQRRLTVTTLHAHDGSVHLVVNDTGCGIAPDQLEKLFQPFFTTKENGLGLGLSICRKIALAHGGTLTAQSLDGDGASLRLMLPALPARPRRG
jgi:two-component system, LuxR family, sensor kinase FixL